MAESIKPAVGQTWRSPRSGREFTIANIEGEYTYWTAGGWDWTDTVPHNYGFVRGPRAEPRSARPALVGVCSQRNPVDGEMGGLLLCTLDEGHDGDHEAHGCGGRCIQRWPREDALNRVSIGGVEVPCKIEREQVRGAGGDVIGKTSGRVVYVNNFATGEDATKGAEAIRNFFDRWMAEETGSCPVSVGHRAHDGITRVATIEHDEGAPVGDAAKKGLRDAVERTMQDLWNEDKIALAPPDPRAEREQRRREIDAVIAEDARRFPAFATARRAAVVAKCEGEPAHDTMTTIHAPLASAMLGWLREYEEKRGAGRAPSEAANFHARVTFGTDAQAVYERARSLP
jgi:hypothetical protein